jgi:hypothetical protein
MFMCFLPLWACRDGRAAARSDFVQTLGIERIPDAVRDLSVQFETLQLCFEWSCLVTTKRVDCGEVSTSRWVSEAQSSRLDLVRRPALGESIESAESRPKGDLSARADSLTRHCG